MDSGATRADLVIREHTSQAMEADGITQADLSKALEGRSKGQALLDQGRPKRIYDGNPLV